MSLAPINWRPDRKALAEFSEAWMFFLGMVAAPLMLHRGQPRLAAAFWVLAVAGRLIGLIRPMLLRPVYLGLTLATWPIGWAVSGLTLALLYYGILTPIGLTFRLIGRDALNRRFDRNAPTYWEPYTPDHGPEANLRQF